MGRDVSVKTEGMVNGVLSINQNLLGTTLHIVDRKYAGDSDGYLGFDFICAYRAVLNFRKMYLKSSAAGTTPAGRKQQAPTRNKHGFNKPRFEQRNVRLAKFLKHFGAEL